MRVLVTGVKGQLGHDVVKVLESRSVECLGADLEQFDITDRAAVRSFLTAYAPDVVVHCSAFTAVDRAEDEEALCRRVNAEGPRNIAEVCKDLGAKLVYFSTDYVFPGSGEQFYKPEDPTGPTSVYGKTKLEGEEAVKALLERYFILRISWVFGKNGNNFIKTMIRLAENHEEVRVVRDQVGSPTYTADLAPLVCDMMITEQYGTYHVTNEGVCSWAEFAEQIFRKKGLSTKVVGITTEEFGAKAPRPFNSRMSKEKLVRNGFYRLPTWQDALERYLRELEAE